MPELSALSGVSEDNIIQEEARFYNRRTNPDTGTGITLNQGNANSFGIPEFSTVNGRVGIKNGNIFRIEGKNRIPVGVIDEVGEIELF